MANAAYIFDAVRTPRGRGKTNGSLYTVKAVDLLATSLRALAERNNLREKANSALIDDVSIGCVTQTGEQGSCIARSGVLLADLDESVPGVTLNRFCGSGLEAVNEAAAKVAAGFADLTIGGGVESMSRVPMGSDGGALWDPTFEWALRHRAAGHLGRPAGHAGRVQRAPMWTPSPCAARRTPPPPGSGASSAAAWCPWST